MFDTILLQHVFHAVFDLLVGDTLHDSAQTLHGFGRSGAWSRGD
jgi:hypothetical protein